MTGPRRIFYIILAGLVATSVLFWLSDVKKPRSSFRSASFSLPFLERLKGEEAWSEVHLCHENLLAAEEGAAKPKVTKDWRERLKEINDEIDKTEDARAKYLSAAARAEDQGMRWQFMQDQKQEARLAFQRADDFRKAAKMLQAHIDALNKEKAQILKEHVDER